MKTEPLGMFMDEFEPEYAGFKVGDLVVPLDESISWKYTGCPIWTEEIVNKTPCTPGMILSLKRQGINSTTNIPDTRVTLGSKSVTEFLKGQSFLFKVLLGTAVYHMWSFDLKKREYETVKQEHSDK